MASSNVMRDTFKLPKLPGNSFQEEMMRKSFKKRQMMQPLTGPKPMEVDKIPVDFEAIRIAREDTPTEQLGGLSLDRRVLRFTAYFREGVHESRLESERIRRCLVYYFLEDDTISVSEPREDNAGMPQGCMLKRHQILKPDNSNQHYSFEDLNVGKTVVFYQKTFVLCDCDAFTRNFLTGLGLDVAEPTSFPNDEYQNTRNKPDKKPRDAEDKHLVAVMEYNYSGKRSRLSSDELKAAKQFLLNDRKVLKFSAKWDDRNSLYGDERKFTLYYFLADDTIEVTEELPLNAGRDPFPSFVRRRKCAKPTDRFENPKASLCFKNDPQQCYSDVDLYIGATVEVFGRKFLLVSCDEFTNKYLYEIHGREPCPPVQADEKVAQKPKVVPPPYNGFGDEDDSLGSWKNLVLKPPKKNVKQYIENSGTMMKFTMKLDAADPANEVRRFVLTYYLADDTISIFEPAQRNSGIIGGKFLQRQKAKHSDTGDVLRAEDLFVGAKVSVNHHRFIIFATDEKSLSFMEQNSKKFSHSNINIIMRKLRAMLLSTYTDLEQRIIAADGDGNGSVDYQEITSMFRALNLPITEHDTLTLLRYLDVNKDGSVTYAELVQSILPDGGARANTINRPWEDILAESDTDIVWEESSREDELNRQQARSMTAASTAAAIIQQRFEARRALFISAIGNESDKSADSKMGAKEFSSIIQRSLKLPIDAPSLAALCSKLFPASLPRVEYTEMIRIIQGTSLHNTTIPGIASYSKKK